MKERLVKGESVMLALAVCFLIAVLVMISFTDNSAQDEEIQYEWRSYSLFERAYWINQSETMTEIYEILYPDDPIDLQMNTNFDDLIINEQYVGYFSIYSNLHSVQIASDIDEIIFPYTDVLSFIYQIGDYSVNINYQNYSIAKGPERNAAALKKIERLAYPYTRDGLQSLLNDSGFAMRDKDVDALWQISQRVNQQERQMQLMQDMFADYDVQIEALAINYDADDQVYVWINESGELDGAQRTEYDYLITALLVLASCPEIDQLDLAFIEEIVRGEDGDSYEIDTQLAYQRDELEAEYGTLNFNPEQPVEEQIQILLERV